VVILDYLRLTYCILLLFKIDLLSTISIEWRTSESLSLRRVASEALWHILAYCRTSFTNSLHTHIIVSSINNTWHIVVIPLFNPIWCQLLLLEQLNFVSPMHTVIRRWEVIYWSDLLEITTELLIVVYLRWAHLSEWIVINVVARYLIAEGLHHHSLR